MFEQTFKNIDDILFKDAGADSELDYIGQTSWVMFLRYLDELESKKADEAELRGDDYSFIIDEEYRWNNWAMPKGPNGKIDHNVAMTGPDLVEFVDRNLFPYMAGFKQRADNPKTIEYKIGEIFSELKNKIQSGYNLREILEYADELEFRLSDEQHELSSLYETKIKNMGNAGRNGGQYYTPRALIRSIIKVVDPQIGETVYDGAVGSAGFLCEAFDHMSGARDTLSTDDLATLKEDTFYGKEKKNLAYIIGVMNMILHGIEAPNIIHTNTLGENLRDIQEKDRQLKRQRDEYEKRISELNQQVQNLQDKIENIAIQATKRPTTINNQQKINLVQNLKPITEQHLREQVENFGMEHFKNGIQGLAKYAVDYPLKDRVICTDDSRYQFKWRDGDNDDSVVCDRKMITLVKKLFMALRDKNAQLADVAVKEMRERYFQLTRQVENNEEDIDLQHAKLIEIAEQITKYNSFRENVNRLAEGEEIDIYKKFIDIVCSHVSSNSKILVSE